MPENNERRAFSLLKAGFAAAASRNFPRELVNQIRERGGTERILWSRPPLIQTRTSPKRLEMFRNFFPDRTRYLEIGLSRGKTLESVRFEVRHAVDPFPRINLKVLPRGVTVFQANSDDFFRSALSDSEPYDVVFVDGLHTWEQTYRDILNTFRLSPQAIVLVDDVVPSDAISAMRNFEESLLLREKTGQASVEWCGDVFRAILVIEEAHPDIEFLTFASGGYPQTVMWLRNPKRFDDRERESSEIVASSANFQKTFENGFPTQFHPASFGDVMDAVRGAVEKRT